jgi:hypothetical protein
MPNAIESFNFALVPDAVALAGAGDETTWCHENLVGLHASCPMKIL